jgi:hypothetical protein
VLRSLGIDAAQAGLPAHTEHYEHLGVVRCFVRDLMTAPPAHPSLAVPSEEQVA